MSIRHTILDWAGRGAIGDVRAALELGGVLPGAREWRSFLDRLLTWSAAVALAAAAVFLIAYNWSELGRFAKLALAQALVLAALLGYWRFGPDSPAGKAALLAGSIFLGALLALFGQTYQTGADTWELFANWAALILPWVLVGRFAGLWMLWLAIANVAIVFYYSVFPGLFGLLFRARPELWTLFVFNTAALLAWELAARRFAWLNERWAPRLLAIASGGLITALVLEVIFGSWEYRAREPGGMAALVYPAWLIVAYAAYRTWIRDVFVLAGGCLSLIVVVTSFFAKQMFQSHNAEATSFLLIAVIVIVMAAVCGWWLKEVAREARA